MFQIALYFKLLRTFIPFLDQIINILYTYVTDKPSSIRSTPRSPTKGDVSNTTRDMKTLDPDPILRLRKIIGFGYGLENSMESRAYRFATFY